MANTATVTDGQTSSQIMEDTRGAIFDAGINSSAAWTGNLERKNTEEDNNSEESWIPTDGKPARVLHDFKGDSLSSELSVRSGEEIVILMEDVMDGWSLAKRMDATSSDVLSMGLLPRKCYVLTVSLEMSPEVLLSPMSPQPSVLSGASKIQHSPGESAVPEQFKLPLPPLTVHPTGFGLFDLRAKLLGGKSLNRFSSFVATGTEDWVLNGSREEPYSGQRGTFRTSSEDSGRSVESDGRTPDPGENAKMPKETERHFVETPPSWRAKIPAFSVIVHSPSKRNSKITGAYTMYSVTSMFSPPSTHVTVYRRFSQFTFLHAALSRRLPGIAVPPLPEKQYTGRFNDDFVEARRGDLERWLGSVVRHPLARYAEVVTFFLGCEDDIEWKRRLPGFLAASPTPGPSFYSQVFHPAFNVDAEEALDTVNRFERHVKGVGEGVHNLRIVYNRLRESSADISLSLKAFSYQLFSLITSSPAFSAPTPHAKGNNLSEQDDSPEAEHHPRSPKSTVGLFTPDGAWCWREECDECLVLTKALQKMAECLQTVADLHDDHAGRTQLATHEFMKHAAHPKELYAPVVEIHRSALSHYLDHTSEIDSPGRTKDANIAARCETVLNATMAEFETYHAQKNEDFRRLAIEHLDGEIALHEQVLTRLRIARSAFDDPPNPTIIPPGPRRPSIYERHESQAARMTPTPLVQPTPHVFDATSTGLRPVAWAVREGVGMLFGSGAGGSGGGGGGGGGIGPSFFKPGSTSSSPTRSGSVFGRLW